MATDVSGCGAAEAATRAAPDRHAAPRSRVAQHTLRYRARGATLGWGLGREDAGAARPGHSLSRPTMRSGTVVRVERPRVQRVQTPPPQCRANLSSAFLTDLTRAFTVVSP